MSRRLRSCALVAASALAGCGESVTAPDPTPLALAGEWTYTAAGLSGFFGPDPVTCRYDLLMELETTPGQAFSGRYSDALLVCELFGAPQIVDGGSGRIVAGLRTGDDVEFDFDAASFHNTGRLSETGLAGQIRLELVVQHGSVIDTVEIVGPWQAVR